MELSKKLSAPFFKGARRLSIRITGFVLTAGLIASATLSGASAAEVRQLVPVGRAVGIKVESQGVLILGIPDCCADGVTPSPSKESGLQVGDIIVDINGSDVSSSKDIKEIMESQDGRPLVVKAEREGETVKTAVTPHKTAEGAYSLGLLVRDGVSGIGTITFYDPETGDFGALGHGVNDSETGVLVPIREGYISDVSVTDVVKGKTGSPGQLHGAFDFDKKMGQISFNTNKGIFGKLTDTNCIDHSPLPIGLEGEIKTGPAHILSNVSGTTVKKYDIEISRIFTGDEAQGRSVMITITDLALQDFTGGIVQGMSGSPIIQNGKIIGAVTHVLVNDPTRGYGISITKMLDQIENAPKSKKADAAA